MTNGDPNNCANDYFPYDDGTCPPGRVHLPGPNQYYCSIPPVDETALPTKSLICPPTTHPDPRDPSLCFESEITTPNADGSCPTGYHPSGDIRWCVKVYSSTATGKSCLPGYHLDTSSPPTCIPDTPPPATGATTPSIIPPNADGSCPKGYHIHYPDNRPTTCILNTPSTTGTTTGTTTGAPNCTGEMHLDNGKCVGNDVRLPSGDCVPGYHLGSKPDVVQPGRFLKVCVKDTPTTTGTTGTTKVTCVGETHYDKIQGQCLTNSIPLPCDVGSTPLCDHPTCVPGYHYGLLPGGETQICIKDPPCPEAGTQYDPQSGKCLFQRVPDNTPTTPSKSDTGTGGVGGGTHVPRQVESQFW